MLPSRFSSRFLLPRRMLFFSLVALSTAAAAYMMADVLRANGFSVLEMAILLFFTVSFAWIATSFWTASIGTLFQALKRDPITLRRMNPAGRGDAAPITTRTAIVMPIYNEDTNRVLAGMEAIHASVAATGELEHFDFFILSDTQDPSIAANEEAGWAAFVNRVGGSGHVFYRRRTVNSGRKAGNLADFCTQWGLNYEHMVVLDADSVMSGETIVRMVRLMEANPRAGIIQTVPVPVNRETLFARFVQFACRLYGPILSTGLSFWQLGDGNYWGHNAIIRVRPFIDHCGLPRLPGDAPLGGEILSHDFVEAALVRRGGWSVWLVPELEGSYEEVPPNVIDYAKRDRRWCQGNLQHLALLPLQGLHPLSRLHLLMGVMAYVASPLWLCLLLLSTTDIVMQAYAGHSYFLPGYNLFPVWPVSKTAELVSLFGVTVAILLLPKIFGITLALCDTRLRRGFGGGARLLSSALAEQFFSMLLAPAMMLFHSHFVVATLFGKGVSWNAQSRDDRGLKAGEAVARHGLHTVVGLLWAGIILAIAPDFFWWLMPVVVGLVLAIPLSMLSSRLDVGRATRRWGLFLTPEESDPPSELKMLGRLLSRHSEPVAVSPVMPALPMMPERQPCLMSMQPLQYWPSRSGGQPAGMGGRVAATMMALVVTLWTAR